MSEKITYDDIYSGDLNIISEALSKYDGEKTWKYFKVFYKDPDGYYKKYREYADETIECTADGLLSVKRIKNFEGFSEEFLKTFKKYRKHPIIFFPPDSNKLPRDDPNYVGGINWERSRIFGDRIDYTFFDIKMYCDGKKDCKLVESYKLEETQKWFKSFDYDFSKIVEWMKIGGIFVDDELNVYDLEYDDGRPIFDYRDEYPYGWSEKYYENVKKKIEEFYEKNH